MRRYETIYIIKAGASEEEKTAIIDRATAIIEEGGGFTVTLDRWGVKKLAYEISKEAQGYYVYFEYASTPEAVAEMERIFRIDDNVLKYLTVKLQDVYSEIPADETRKAGHDMEEEVEEEEAEEA